MVVITGSIICGIPDILTPGAIDLPIITSLVIVLLLLLLSAFVSGSEVALFSLSESDLRRMGGKQMAGLRRIEKLLAVPSRLLATVLIANNIINITLVVVSTFVFQRLSGIDPVSLSGFLILAVGIIIIVLVFGEMVPKVLASRNAIPFALAFSGYILFLYKLFYPLATILMESTSIANKRFSNYRKAISMDDLSEAIEMASKDIKDEKALLKGVVKFGNIGVTDIMQPRVDVVAVDVRMGFKDLMGLIVESGYSRIPVYDGSFDTIRGVLYVKDLLPHIHKPGFDWLTLIRPPYYVPETKKISSLLKEFQSNKIHMAIVVDEYGGSSGIITLEDILEEIVGEITDESDDVEIHFTRLDECNFMFEGKTQLNDFCKIVAVDESLFDDIKGDAETLAGLLLEINGVFPGRNQVITFRDFVFTISQVDKRRIKQIHVQVPKTTKTDEISID